MVHRNSAVTPEQLDTLRKYLTALSGEQQSATSSHVEAADREYVRWVDNSGITHAVESTLAGVSFHLEYRTWKQIGSTERIENHTIRVVLGNDLAIRAIADNHINPWPNGTMIGKVTWHCPDSHGDRSKSISTPQLPSINAEGQAKPGHS
jgi:hypothetical protein